MFPKARINIPHIHIGSDAEVAGVLVHTWSCLTDARVIDELYSSAGSGMVEDIVLNAVPLNNASLVQRGSSWSSAGNGGKSKSSSCEEFHPGSALDLQGG